MNLIFFTYFMFQFFQCWQEFFEGGVHNTMVCSLWLVFIMFFLIIMMVQIDFLALKVKLAHKTNSYSYQLTVGLPCHSALHWTFFICTHIKVSDFFVLPSSPLPQLPLGWRTATHNVTLLQFLAEEF